MMTRFRNWAFAMVAVGLLGGPAVWAQSTAGDVVQADAVRYAVTLLDASGPTPPTTFKGAPANADSTAVRVKVTVSIPRTGPTYTATVATLPSRLMFRAHRGDATAFDGSILLVRDAPYTDAAGTTPAANTVFYPMPQVKGQTQTVDYTGVASGAGLPDYVAAPADTSTVNPARWECTYLSADVYPTDVLEGNDPSAEGYNALVASLWNGQGTHEWYAAGYFGLGFTRVSDIQDAGRNQSFTDAKLWVDAGPDADSEDNPVKWNVLTDTAADWGTIYHWRLGAMPGASWEIHGGVIGVSPSGMAGLHLLGEPPPTSVDDGSSTPRVESPTLPDGVSAVTFRAACSEEMDNQQLTLQVLDGGEWVDVETLTIGATLRSYTVEVPAERQFAERFRILRVTTSVGGEQNLHTIAIRDLLVRSAAPVASFDAAPAVSPDPLFDGDAGWSVTFAATPDGNDALAPRGYEAEVFLRRRANGDATAQWRPAANVSVEAASTAIGASAIAASFTHGTLTTGAAGAVNVTENAFFLNGSNRVTGLLPGVYDARLDYGILGSFLAGRDVIDRRETVTGSVSTYTVQVANPDYDPEDSNSEEFLTERHPMVVDLREQETAHEGVFLRLFYRSGDIDSGYTFLTRDVPMLPDAKEPHLWRADIPRVLREATESNGVTRDETAVYVWAPDSLFGLAEPSHDATGTEGYLAFRVCATAPDGTAQWYGTGASGNDAMPAVATAAPATTVDLVAAGLAGEGAATPVVVPTAIPNSHVSVAFAINPGSTPELSLVGSYCQDFNAWYAAGGESNGGFTNTDFREDLDFRIADFNIPEDGFSTNETTGEVTVLKGWIPDEGPLAESSSFTDAFAVTRYSDETASYSFYYGNTDQSGTPYFFRQWGAGYLDPRPQYLTPNTQAPKTWSDYFILPFSSGVVLRRRYTTDNYGNRMPDAMVQLLPGDGLKPNPRMTLRGVGTVTLSYSLSMPYDHGYRAQLFPSNTPEGSDGSGYGFAAGIDSSGFANRCAPSGFSVSYFLESDSVSYELRLTQLLDYPAEPRELPTERVYAELYRWPDRGTPTRIPIQPDSGTGQLDARQMNAALAGNTYAFWVDGQNKLCVGVANSSTATQSVPRTFRSNASVDIPADGFSFALGSAQCAPSFRSLTYLTAKGDNYSGSTAFGTATTAETSDEEPTWGPLWTVQAEQTGGTVRVTRNIPSSTRAGTFSLLLQEPESGDAYRNVQLQAEFGVVKTATVTLGRDADLVIVPTLADGVQGTTGIFLDDITVTSWRGDDENRNGDDDVPVHTNVGFREDNGFAAVGVWVRPRDDAELTANPAAYSGEQVLLMQRSRQNNDGGRAETTVNGIKTTSAALALYTPYSDDARGFGPVSFDYCIPPRAEGNTPTVQLMLQYRESNRLSNDYLGDDAFDKWVNASEPVTLDNTTGEWVSASITPRLDGKELIGVSGTLRLVMVIPDTAGTDYDPYVYLDNVTVTDNREGVLASWTAGNVCLTRSPIDLLYWKDRAVAGLADQTEQTFAEKAALTTALQFNDRTVGDLADSFLDSPLLDEGVGVGRVSFAARLASASAEPVRVYISATDSDADVDALGAEDFTILDYVEVKNTVYAVYEQDLSKLAFPEGVGFTYRDIRRLRLWVVPAPSLEPEGHAGGTGRVLIDRLSVSDPVSPSLAVTKVAFSNVNGTKTPAEFNPDSPLSQPVSGAPVLRVRAELGKEQLVKLGSVRVYFTYRVTDASALRATDSTSSYTDVLGNVVSASAERPIYRWSAPESWPLESWFTPPTSYDPADMVLLDPDHTVELTRADNAPIEDLNFYGDLSETGITGLPENSIVRYAVWAVYQSDQLDADGNPSDEWFLSVISASDYKEPAWYFPRNLNQEIRDARNAGLEENDPDRVGPSSFSPYFWMYSCVPGEVFLNELNFVDSDSATNPDLAPFAEICVPVGVNLAGWAFGSTQVGSNGNTQLAGTIAVPEDYDAERLAAPENGVVPVKRQGSTSANRTFYTISESGLDLDYRPGNAADAALQDALVTEDGNARPLNHRNAGWWNRSAASVGSPFATGGNGVTSALLYRPTGGAEHIVIFSNATNNTASATSMRDALTALHTSYTEAYVGNGFRKPWSQDFLEESWEDLTADYADDKIDAATHARRLAVVDTYHSATSGGRYSRNATTEVDAYERDTRAAVAVSLATVDMGGKWVTRRNDVFGVGLNGPSDLTHILVDGAFPADFNPTEQTRPVEPVEGNGTIDLDDNAVAPVVQVTPRQVNPDQFLVQYAGLSQCGVTSTISGAGIHTLHIPDATAPTETRRGGNAPATWSVAPGGQPTATLTYDALPFHHLTGLKVRMLDSASGKYLIEGTQTVDGRTLPGLASQIDIPADVLDFDEITEDFWVPVNLPADTTTFDIAATLYNLAAPDDTETRYLFEAQATFAFNPNDPEARSIITGVRPCTALGEPDENGNVPVSARRNQPWWGSGFGFEADYDAARLTRISEDAGATVSLSSILILYPDPAHRTETDPDNAPWLGLTTLEGLTLAQATDALSDTGALTAAGARSVRLDPVSGRFANASLVGVLGTAYADLDASPLTGDDIEPAIPYFAWGVYTVTFPTDTGTGSVDFLMRQALPGEGVDPFTFPAWYAPLTQTIDLPHFYLYSTPVESAWVNEVNIASPAGDGTALSAEVVLPILRAGITAAGVPQPSDYANLWEVQSYGPTGAPEGSALVSATGSQSGSVSYAYHTAGVYAPRNGTAAYVLIRPCGAAEGGVWLAADATGGTPVNGPTSLTTNPWLSAGGSGNVFNGVTDSTDVEGTVQLVGQLVASSQNADFTGISSVAAERTEWAFRDATLGGDNLDGNGNPVTPDPDPDWNRVAFTVTPRNAAFGTGACGVWTEGYFSDSTVAGRTEQDTVTHAGGDWVYLSAAGRDHVLSFRPRSGYCFSTIALPPDLIGHVMLVGAPGGIFTGDNVADEYTRLQGLVDAVADDASKEAIRRSDWLTLGGRATVDAATGLVTFNRDFDEGDGETFADQDDFVITLLFVDEPVSAQNQVVVSFDQGESGPGAWLATQTFFAVDAAGDPIADKGGDATTFPIWTDEDGNARGEHANVHGWLHQPLVGDRLGMAAVLDPARGLLGGALGTTVTDVYQTFRSGAYRPYLVWALIPASVVDAADPLGADAAQASARQDFFDNWPLTRWLGGAPSILNGTATSLSINDVRTTLQGNIGSTTDAGRYFAAAGIVPLQFAGYRDLENGPESGLVTPDLDDPLPEHLAEDLRIAFHTMSDEAFAAAQADGRFTNPEGLLPFSASIDMSDETVWKNGAVLRFAIVIGNDTTFVDAQGIANFTSDGLDAYCPWYLPDEEANINAAATAGVSPYAWVYDIAPDGVWFNELRPPRSKTNPDSHLTYAVELAMDASPVAIVSQGDDPANLTYRDPLEADFPVYDPITQYLRPKRSLDGWSIRLKVAPLPLSTDPLDVPIAWTAFGDSAELKGWVPFRRIRNGNAEDLNAYDLDYYVVAEQGAADGTVGFGMAEDDASAEINFNPDTGYAVAADGTGNANGFTWFPAPAVSAAALPEGALDFTTGTDYAEGALYAIELVRDNGVVADEVLFCSYPEGWDFDTLMNRLQRAVDIENASAVVSNPVRAVKARLDLKPIQGSDPAPGTGADTDPATEDEVTSGDGIPTWSYMLGDCTKTQDEDGVTTPIDLGTVWASAPDGSNALPGPNQWDNGPFHYTQPKSAYRNVVAGETRTVSAQIVGGDGLLGLTRNSSQATTGRTVSFRGLLGDRYTLSVAQPWDANWFRLDSLTKNGRPFNPAQARRLTTFSVGDAGALAADASLTLDDTLLEQDTDYVLTLVYTPGAALLDRAGALNSDDAGFFAWLRKVAPDAIVKQTQADGVTAAEKYWLGFADAAQIADVDLAFTAVGTYDESADALGETADTAPKPTVSLRFTSDGKAIDEIKGDGVLLLLGKVSLDDPDWRFVRRLYPEDLNGDRVLILDTDCNFFRAVLLSARDAEEVGR